MDTATNENVVYYFRNRRTEEVAIVSEKPQNSTSLGSFAIRGSSETTRLKMEIVESNEDPSKLPCPTMTKLVEEFGVSEAKGHVPYLKSVWQKMTRCSDTANAVRLALTLLCADEQAFLRRLPIVAIEDSLPHPKLPSAVWIMVAHSKGRTLTFRDIDLLMNIVVDVASSKYRDAIHQVESFHLGEPLLQAGFSPKDDDPIVACLWIRAAWGGTGGDVEMLRRSAMAWRLRFLDSDALVWRQIVDGVSTGNPWTKIAEHATSPLVGSPKSHNVLPICGADFHCFPHIATQLSKQHGIHPDKIRKAIWFWSSSVTDKIMISDPRNFRILSLSSGGVFDLERSRGRNATEETWSVVRDDFHLLATKCIEELGSKPERLSKFAGGSTRRTSFAPKKPENGARQLTLFRFFPVETRNPLKDNKLHEDTL